MKIAILSLNPGHNYGGILQSYALKTVLERMGHEVSVISKERPMPPMFSLRNVPRYAVRLMRRLLKGSKTPIFAEYYYEKDKRTRYQHTLRFCSDYLNLKKINSFGDILPNEFDAFIVGSDQVWCPKYFEEQFSFGVENAYLSFASSWNVKRIAYAPSFGVDKWEYSQQKTEECAILVAKFNALSVREQSGLKLCKEYLKREDAVQLCDPTMLLTRDDYEQLITSDTPQSKGSLLVYCLDNNEELDKLVSRISKEKKLIPFSTNPKPESSITPEEYIKPSVPSWLRAFKEAEFVITDSFHACVFSLVFNKPFLVFGNANRGLSRFESLLSTFGQQQRMLTCAGDYNKSREYPSLDNVDEILSRLRSEAFDYLNKSMI